MRGANVELLLPISGMSRSASTRLTCLGNFGPAETRNLGSRALPTKGKHDEEEPIHHFDDAEAARTSWRRSSQIMTISLSLAGGCAVVAAVMTFAQPQDSEPAVNRKRRFGQISDKAIVGFDNSIRGTGRKAEVGRLCTSHVRNSAYEAGH